MRQGQGAGSYGNMARAWHSFDQSQQFSRSNAPNVARALKGRMWIVPRNTVSAIGILYVVVAANYVGDVFACDLQRLLTHSMLTKQLVLVLGALVWVVEAYDSTDLSFTQILLKSSLLYILFLLSTKSTAATLLPMLTLMLVDQVLRVWEQRVPKGSDHANKVTKLRHGIHIACVVAITGGAAVYAHKQVRDHGDAFSWIQFLFGTPKCRGVVTAQ